MFSEENKDNDHSLDLAPLEELLGYGNQWNEGLHSIPSIPASVDFKPPLSPLPNQNLDDQGMEGEGEGDHNEQKTIQEKREKGRIRSKISRERRKAYVAKLENRIDHLEKENSRLQNIIVNLHSEKYNKTDPNTKTYLQDIQELKGITVEHFWDKESMEHKQERKISVGKNYGIVTGQTLEKHK